MTVLNKEEIEKQVPLFKAYIVARFPDDYKTIPNQVPVRCFCDHERVCWADENVYKHWSTWIAALEYQTEEMP